MLSFTAYPVSTRSVVAFFVALTTIPYASWWLGIAAVHIIYTSNFALVCWAYWCIPHTNITVGFEMYGVIMPLTDFRLLSLVYGAIAVAHVLSLIEMLFASCRSRCLAVLFHYQKYVVKDA